MPLWTGAAPGLLVLPPVRCIAVLSPPPSPPEIRERPSAVSARPRRHNLQVGRYVEQLLGGDPKVTPVPRGGGGGGGGGPPLNTPMSCSCRLRRRVLDKHFTKSTAMGHG
eukprot:SAG11_NODE_2373_length_3445_cov_11.317693_4_plen_110_part_00